jgi:meso-butanediol dehydrogenase/(S,S)-butanediol dehydrogenase/diacetyl reductase
MRFQGQGVVVTGGGSGIGQQVCYAAAKEGASIAVADLSLERAQATADTITRSNGAALAYQVDVSDPDGVSKLMASAAADLPSLDVLVNSAGVREITSVLDLAFEEWQKVLSVNLSGTFLPSQRFAQKLVADGKSGRIVNLASTLGLAAAPNRAAYTASKHGVVGLTKQMALELADRGIRVNAVAPGVIRTALTESYFDGAEYEKVVNDMHPIGRVGEPQEIANAILFLADEANGFMTGSVLAVDGGWGSGKKF